MLLLISWMLMACLSGAVEQQPDPEMQVTYHPKAKAPYNPREPMWSGEPPCSQFPTSGEGTLRVGDDSSIKPPKLRHRKTGDYSTLTSKTRLFAPFVAEYTISAQGRVSSVRVLRSVSDEFDRLILAELASSSWTPATLKGVPVAACVAFTARPHP